GHLDALVDHYAPAGEVNLVGHSMGANVVCLYAGARPERVRRVGDLEGFGLAPARAEQAPRRLRGVVVF
ncbi:alpha/beta hydrolase, partial [Burkholderia sp. Tr-20390]|uniref:alpha/beta hydrolase n=1 Tax=Burkholderia sp. Tr-20390 TaxID=2703904 RepID=UPI001F124A94|nr:alpha/beta hydrolase [Burkholderia sp. Tr-20390]